MNLYVIDGMALLFRSFYAMGRVGLASADGTPTGAMYGFLKTTFKIIKEQRPDYLIVAWDNKSKTFRHDMYPPYKGTRSETPPELIIQIPLIQKLIEEIKIPAFNVAGFEADDIIGTLCTAFDGDSYIVSADKDFLQLVSDRVKVLSLKKGDEFEVWGHSHVVDYFGVGPKQVTDVLALMGDSVDNVPGVKGIGGKGAAKLIQEFGSFDALFANLDAVKNERLRNLLKESKEIADLSHRLVVINQSVPLNLNWQSLQFDLHTVMQAGGESALVQQYRLGSVFGKSNKAKDTVVQTENSLVAADHKPSQDTPVVSQVPCDLFGVPLSTPELIPSVPVKVVDVSWGARRYHVVKTKAELSRLCGTMVSSETKVFAFDTETTGLDMMDDKPIGISVCFEAGEAYYIPACEQHLGADFEFTISDVWQEMNHAFCNRQALAIAHNLKFDLHQLLNVGVSLGNAPIACTMIGAWIGNPISMGYGLDNQTLKRLGLSKIPTSDLIGKDNKLSMSSVPIDKLTEYACEDVDATFRIWASVEADMHKTGVQKLFYELEMPLLRILAAMERNGVHIDSVYLGELATQIKARIGAIETEVFGIASQTFNLSSPKQLGAFLFDIVKVHEALGFKGKLAKTTLGYKTDAAVLDQFEAHPVVKLVQEHRELSKLQSTYVSVLPQLVKHSTGRIHTHFNQIGTATGRLSSTDPNLQNIPIRTPLGRKVRQAFTISKPGNVIVTADYSQIELRVLAHLSGDETMVNAFRSGADIHKETAAKIMGKALGDVTSDERSNAKAINFGIIYGMGPQRLAKTQGISTTAAKAFIDRYFMNYAKVRDFLDSKTVEAHETGGVRTDFGRFRPIPNIAGLRGLDLKSAENIATNSPIQGTAADIMKLGMLRVASGLAALKLETKLLLQVHDELVLEGPSTEIDAVTSLLKDSLEHAVQFVIPMSVEVHTGTNWLDAKG